MNEELYVENVSFGVPTIDTTRIFSRVGQIVSVRLVIDPETGKKKWQAFKEIALKVNAESVIGLAKFKLLANEAIGIVKRNPLLAVIILMLIGSVLIFGGSFSRASLPVASETVLAPAHRVPPAAKMVESEIDVEIRAIMEKGINLKERRRQVTAISATFARRTDPQRARRLAALCYLKTLGTPFMPLDIAVIALAETGEFGLSGKAVSPKGALGVWQLMPHRAMSHGYSPSEMKNDEKCAEAAVRELTSKLIMAKGNKTRANKLYCGAGPAADAYAVKVKQYKKEILEELKRIEQKRGVVGSGELKNFS